MSTPGGRPVAELAFAAAASATFPPAVQVERLRRLLHKYELLICLSAGEPGRTAQRRDAMRAIAQRFPAALREWEEQPAAELHRRYRVVADQLAKSERGGTSGDLLPAAPPEDWLRYGLDLHDCLRAVLQLRSYLSQQAGGRRTGRASAAPVDGQPSGPTVESLAACQDVVKNCEVPWLAVTPELLGAIAEPASGRLTALAYHVVAQRHGTSAATIKIALFGAAAGTR